MQKNDFISIRSSEENPNITKENYSCCVVANSKFAVKAFSLKTVIRILGAFLIHDIYHTLKRAPVE